LREMPEGFIIFTLILYFKTARLMPFHPDGLWGLYVLLEQERKVFLD
jgi:hypothetical protein